jgi:hypothetical protein
MEAKGARSGDLSSAEFCVGAAAGAGLRTGLPLTWTDPLMLPLVKNMRTAEKKNSGPHQEAANRCTDASVQQPAGTPETSTGSGDSRSVGPRQYRREETIPTRRERTRCRL